MATFNPGTDGDLTSATLEGAFAQMVVLINGAIASEPNADQGSVTYTINPTTGQMTGNYDLPISFTGGGGGSFTITPTNTLAVTFAPGTGGDLSATDYPSAFIELLESLQSAELAEGVGPGSGVSMNVNTDTLRISGAFSNPVSLGISGGGIEVIPTEYTA